MILYTRSKGILARRAQVEACLGHGLARLSSRQLPQAGDVLVGWGLKANTRTIRAEAARLGLPYWHLEDGFIGYLGHPARGGHALSLVADDAGIYYDASAPSRLEQLIADEAGFDAALAARTERLIAAIRRFGITKYNCYASKELPVSMTSRLAADPRPRILLVDQVAGDASIPGALADESDFLAMVEQARARHPGAQLLLRTHPDTRFGRKSGVLAQQNLPDLEILAEPCHPHALISTVDAVYTVSSQLGFEALLLGKPVHCFGLPFYAGWGLTEDSRACPRRQTVSLTRLVAATLIRYPRYRDPILGRRCEVEEVVRLIANQSRPAPGWRRLYLVGFSPWKRAFMRAFCAHLRPSGQRAALRQASAAPAGPG